MKSTAEARARYELHRTARHRIRSDLGAPDRALNQKLTAFLPSSSLLSKSIGEAVGYKI
jgi:hypothetical protein